MPRRMNFKTSRNDTVNKTIFAKSAKTAVFLAIFPWWALTAQAAPAAAKPPSVDCKKFKASSLVGMKTQPIPNRWDGKDHQADLVVASGGTTIDSDAPDPTFGLDDLWVCGSKRVIALSNGSLQIKKILAAVELPAFQPGEDIGLASCQLNKKEDPELFAIVKVNRTQNLLPVRMVWRANRQTGTISKISSKGVRCLNIYTDE